MLYPVESWLLSSQTIYLVLPLSKHSNQNIVIQNLSQFVQNSREARAKFKNEIEISNLSRRLNPNLMTDPNLTYNILEDAILSARDKHMPKRNVRFNKYKHKMNKWVTTGILKSIRYRNSLYKKLKSTPYNCEQHMTLKLNLKTYNYILNKTIRTAKKEYYFTEFSKYKHDIRKTWDTIKEVICTN